MALEPPPYGDESLSHVMKEWLGKFYRQLTADGSLIPWSQVSKSGSSLTDIQLRLHGDLQNLTSDDHSQYLNRNGVRPMTSHLTMPKTSGIGIKVDEVTPTFGWRDLEGVLVPKSQGVGSPALATFRGNLRWFNYANGDDMDVMLHMPHDYVPGSDIYLHLHWAHNGTNISGSSVINYYISYGKGHSQEPFPAEKNITQTLSGLNLTNTPQYQTRIDEFVISTPGGSATLLDTNKLEPDGLIWIHFDWTTIPTITGGSGKPFGLYLDVHYQSTNLPTKNKAPNFYT
jgi:hypothetical protein